MAERVIIFGDLHLNWQAGKVILDIARQEGIDMAIHLGDEAHKIYPFETGDQIDYDRLYGELRLFRDESSQRKLVCVIGDKTAAVPKDLFRHYVGVGEDGRINGSVVYAEGNILAAHNGRWIMDKYGELIRSYRNPDPLLIAHGHSHSMGVLPEYKWLSDNELVGWLDTDQEYNLEQGRVYWVNPGGNFFQDHAGRDIANFSVYDRPRQRVTLRSIFFDASEVRPTRQ